MTRHYDRQMKWTDECKRSLFRLHIRAYETGMSSADFFTFKSDRIWSSYSFKKLTSNNQGVINGYSAALFEIIQSQLTEWLLYYTNKNGKVVYLRRYQRLPRYIKNNGDFNGNHFWRKIPNKKRIGAPKPWGGSPSKGVGQKR